MVCEVSSGHTTAEGGRGEPDRLVWTSLPDSLARGEESAESPNMRHTFAHEVPHQYVAFTHGLAR